MFDPSWQEPPDLPGELNDEPDPLELLEMKADLEAQADEDFEAWVASVDADYSEEPGCGAYKPWISVTCHDGTLQPACAKCPKLGACMWTTPADARLAKTG